ncbi:hypothetical protein [Streptomyces iconiensis]|uniref:Uncharacterized protein n=1 Tax=Streptomyces iconiensis TaxID=1384038 RepID=A0ABT7A6Z5_9ACTN|nr:hypothetical protein [Streptomyces iconiensis]MDJ1137084.1 hypothetical protein [Streptomyces iconiensis]
MTAVMTHHPAGDPDRFGRPIAAAVRPWTARRPAARLPPAPDRRGPTGEVDVPKGPLDPNP